MHVYINTEALHATIFAPDNNKYYILEHVFVACNVHEPYCHLCLAGSTIFFYLISYKPLFFRKTLLNTTFVL